MTQKQFVQNTMRFPTDYKFSTNKTGKLIENIKKIPVYVLD